MRIAFVSLLALAAAQERPREPHDFLRTQIGYTGAELAELDAGRAVTRAIDTGEKREIAISGAVHIRASTDFFLRMYEDIERFDTAALAIEKISDPPTPDDFTAMDLPDQDLAGLETCQVSDCDMKLGEVAMERLADEIDWSAPDANAKAENLIRDQAYRFAKAYWEQGSASLGPYRDKKNPASVTEEFEALLASSPYILAYRPELHRYLLDYPQATLDGATDFLYWSAYDYGKPVLRVSHATIYPIERGDNASAIVTGKHIFFSHYFTAGLELHVLARDRTAPGEAFYLVSLIKMRTDGVGGMFGNVLKRNVQKDVMENMQGYLQSTKAAIENYYAERTP